MYRTTLASILVALSCALAPCEKNKSDTSVHDSGAAKVESQQAKPADAVIAVDFDNYNQAETGRNFNNWAKLGQTGGNNTMLYLAELSPIGPNAPTIRINQDTLYSVGVYDNDGEMTVTIPESESSSTVENE
jgi:hypothetical protein